MGERIDAYRAVPGPAPTRTKRWELHGAGIDNLRQVSADLPLIKPDQLLVRHDACGRCFTDIKIINLGGDHPRLRGRNLKKDPVVLGHECIITVLEVGEELKGQYAVGQRL